MPLMPSLYLFLRGLSPCSTEWLFRPVPQGYEQNPAIRLATCAPGRGDQAHDALTRPMVLPWFCPLPSDERPFCDCRRALLQRPLASTIAHCSGKRGEQPLAGCATKGHGIFGAARPSGGGCAPASPVDEGEVSTVQQGCAQKSQVAAAGRLLRPFQVACPIPAALGTTILARDMRSSTSQGLAACAALHANLSLGASVQGASPAPRKPAGSTFLPRWPAVAPSLDCAARAARASPSHAAHTLSVLGCPSRCGLGATLPPRTPLVLLLVR